MMKKIAFLLFLIGAMIFLNTNSAQATPLAMFYEIEDISGGLYNYEFTLTLNNNDGSWAADQGWCWFIFGDRASAVSPLANFVGDTTDLPIGPWTYYTSSSGGHNGPTLGYVLNYWVPTSAGESLYWSGTSSAYLGQGALLFSTLSDAQNNAVPANFEIAQLRTNEPVVPEPATAILLGAGLAGIFLKKRKI